MVKPVCCLVLVLCAAACAPPKAVLVEEAAAAPQPVQKPAAAPADPDPASPRTVQDSGMRIPEDQLINKLPDRRDMTATAPDAPGGGVTASPPAPDKRVSE